MKNRKGDNNIKRWIVLLFISVISIPVFSQLLDSNKIWSVMGGKLYLIKNDTTVINNKVYHYIHKYKKDSTFHYTGSEISYLLREDNGKIYRRNIYLNEDKLLYDFNLSVGDSVYVNPISLWNGDSVLLICQSIDSVTFMGMKRKQLTMETVEPSGFYNTSIEYWVSGIGSTLGLLNPGHLNFANMDQINPLLLCCHRGLNFIKIYQNDSINSCYIPSIAGIHKNKTNLVGIYPNPSHSEITITSDKPIQFIAIFSSNGRLIKEVNGINLSEISLANLDKGIYFIKVYLNTSGKQKSIIKKIIKL